MFQRLTRKALAASVALPIACTSRLVKSENSSEGKQQYLSRSFIADAVEEALPAVVQLNCRSGYMAASFGSGFIVTTDGYVVTNAHVVANAAGGNVQVTLSNSKIKSGKVHAIDTQSDIAVVKINETPGSMTEDYPVVTIGQSSKLRPGDFVIAIGAPVMLKESVTFGIVSSSARLGLNRSHTAYIQTDAAINVGNSGGPLINIDGEVIGINVMKLQNVDGISFAIPIDMALHIINQLILNKRVIRPFVGMKVANVFPSEDTDAANKVKIGQASWNTLAVIETIIKGSPADIAGFQKGDVIQEIDGISIHGALDVINAVGLEVGKELTVKVERKSKYGGGAESISLKLRSVPAKE